MKLIHKRDRFGQYDEEMIRHETDSMQVNEVFRTTAAELIVQEDSSQPLTTAGTTRMEKIRQTADTAGKITVDVYWNEMAEGNKCGTVQIDLERDTIGEVRSRVHVRQVNVMLSSNVMLMLVLACVQERCSIGKPFNLLRRKVAI
eukprot:SAG31_NODE_4763_length_2973_cov_1.655532_1_plen_144_part_10